MGQDYYQILGINRGATESEIQKAYRKLARQYHPDLHPDDASAKTKFQEVQQAYEVLSDPKKREMFDRYGSAYESRGGGWQPPPNANMDDVDFSQFFGGGASGGSAGAAGNPFADLFGQFGGQRRGRRQQGPQRGADMSHEIQVPFNTAVLGGEAVLTVRSKGKNEPITVKIPPAIEDNQKMRLKGKGHPSPNGGHDGDLLLTVKVSAHPFFTRRGKDLELKVPITVGEAVLGAKVEIPSPHGSLVITVPPRTSSGKRLRLAGQGIKPKSGPAGDLFAEVQIVLPEDIDVESTEIQPVLDKFQFQPRAEIRW